MVTQKLVSEREVPMVNPDKRFFPDFRICLDDDVHSEHTEYSYLSVEKVGEKGVALVKSVLAIPGVFDLTISFNELRVSKFDSHRWETITHNVREAFKSVYGYDVKFLNENRLVVMIRRIKVALQINKL